MLRRNFAIVSLVTYGYKTKPQRIIQLTVSKLQGTHYEPIFHTNVNPEEPIPSYVGNRTGLTDAILHQAPSFLDIAQRLLNELDDYILVAHDASLIHYALQSEFNYLGFAFNAAHLCTKRLAKKLMPNMTSYDLSYLTRVLNIPYEEGNYSDRLGQAVSILFQRLVLLDEKGDLISNLLNSKTGKLKNAIKDSHGSKFSQLPNTPGIYKFQNSEGKVIYVGKAKNIKKRVLSHFYSNSKKERLLCESTSDIDFERTGSELIALLREADLIDKLNPTYNYIQKKDYITYHIISQKNKLGLMELKIERRPFMHSPNEIFLKRGDAIKRLIELTSKFRLCPLKTGLKSRLGNCYLDEFSNCDGVCQGKEDIGTYNNKVANALQYIVNEKDNYVIFEKGRVEGEKCLVLVLHGVYQGYGYLDHSQSIASINELRNFIDNKKHSYHTAKIIAAYRTRYPRKVRLIEENDIR